MLYQSKAIEMSSVENVNIMSIKWALALEGETARGARRSRGDIIVAALFGAHFAKSIKIAKASLIISILFMSKYLLCFAHIHPVAPDLVVSNLAVASRFRNATK